MIRTDPKEQLRFSRLQSAPGVEFMTASSSFQPWHVFHERYTFPTRHSAAAGWFYRGRSHFMSDGSTSFLEPGEMHRNTSVHKRSEFQVLFIPPKTFEAYARELGHRHTPHFSLAQTDSPDVHRAVHEACRAADEGRSPLEVESKLLACVRLLLDYSEQGHIAQRATDLHQPVARARSLLRDRFAEAISLDELCRECRVSRFHLAHAFAKEVGLPPHAYQVHVRVERARELLQLGMPPAQVAECVGFADQSHLTRHFKRIMRVTPGAYLRSS